MSTGFSSLYYTDCLPGQGMRGGAGFQFQAVSEGVGHDEMSLVQRSALYEAPVGWMRDQRPVADYPPSLTHVFDGLYATARGIYLGAEANGVREGNQFTHAVTTTDPDAYGQVRPAQLWAAPWWSERSADTTRCDPVEAEPEHGPWGRDAIREWVLGQSGAKEWLIAVNSAFDRLHEPDGRRVVFVASDAESVVGWIAAGTLLLPQSRALRTTFRVFATNPQYSRHHVLAVHPDWAGSYADPGRASEFVVFNLETGTHTEVEPTAAAGFWVPRFLRNDPYDVVDALEWAHECARSRDGEETDADRVAGAVVALAEPVEPSSAAAFARWFSAQSRESVEGVAVELAEAALAAADDAATWQSVDIAVNKHALPGELVARTRCGLLEAELRDVLAGVVDEDRLRHHLPPRRWPEAQLRTMTGMVEREAVDVTPQLMDPLLRTASRFGLSPAVESFGNGAHRFLAWWADHPDAPVFPDAWPNTGAMLTLLRDVLHDRFNAGAGSEADVRAHWWRLLWRTVADPATPLDSALTAAAVAHGDARVRDDTVRRVLGSTDDPEVAWRALFRHTAPTPAELLALVRASRRVSAVFERDVHEALAKSVASGITAQHLEVVAVLVDRGGRPPTGALGQRYRDDAVVLDWLASPSAKTSSPLAKVSSTTIRAHLRPILRVFVDQLSMVDAVKVLEDGGSVLVEELAHALYTLWAKEFTTGGERLRAVALAFVTAGLEACGHPMAVKLESRLIAWIATADETDLADVTAVLSPVGARLAAEWRVFAAKVAERKSKRRTAEPRRPVKAPDAPAPPARWWPRRRREE